MSPELSYRDAKGAIEWLCDVLGMRQGLVVEGEHGSIAHAELWWQDCAIYLGTSDTPSGPGTGTVVCLAADSDGDVDRLYERALSAGADIALPLGDTPFGSHQFVVRDPGGHTWTVGTYRPQLLASDAT